MLIEANIPAVVCSPMLSWQTSTEEKNKVVLKHNCCTIKQMLAEGLVPVLHGDVVFDEKTSFSILSGDTIIKILALELKPLRVVYLSNVDGIFMEPPELNPYTKLIREIALKSDGSFDMPHVNQVANDVTGGMRLKIEEAVTVALSGIRVYIANAGTSSALHACLGLEDLIGTQLYVEH
eukprot:TRINITY_DN5164_c0_g1_i8.p1 TRINITY_DN5164_c0_g1~~TRINITY_DN5164_c0_g1_i8.p1  ORF type:complete len:179 (-),score=23.04 TRINITY_DN5164_c0_g1_i8:379-915(-)